MVLFVSLALKTRDTIDDDGGMNKFCRNMIYYTYKAVNDVVSAVDCTLTSLRACFQSATAMITACDCPYVSYQRLHLSVCRQSSLRPLPSQFSLLLYQVCISSL